MASQDTVWTMRKIQVQRLQELWKSVGSGDAKSGEVRHGREVSGEAIRWMACWRRRGRGTAVAGGLRDPSGNVGGEDAQLQLASRNGEELSPPSDLQMCKAEKRQAQWRSVRLFAKQPLSLPDECTGKHLFNPSGVGDCCWVHTSPFALSFLDSGLFYNWPCVWTLDLFNDFGSLPRTSDWT